MKTREKLITTILDLAGDEYESRNDLVELAIKSEEELIDALISIANYYKEQN